MVQPFVMVSWKVRAFPLNTCVQEPEATRRSRMYPTKFPSESELAAQVIVSFSPPITVSGTVMLAGALGAVLLMTVTWLLVLYPDSRPSVS